MARITPFAQFFTADKGVMGFGRVVIPKVWAPLDGSPTAWQNSRKEDLYMNTLWSYEPHEEDGEEMFCVAEYYQHELNGKEA